MDLRHLQFICTKLKLGSSQGKAERVYGGRGGHLLWRVTTEKGSYCIKQLAPDIDLQNEKNIAKYELSETIAYRFSQQGILAVFAIEGDGNRLTIIEQTGYLIYPWIEGYALKQNEVSETHAIKIAEVTAKLHSANLFIPEVTSPKFDIHSNDSIINAIERAESSKLPFAKILKDKQTVLFTLNEKYLAAIPILKEHSVVTHGDLDQLNVIWSNANQPHLIDWESAKRMNPTQEIVRTSLRFSGVGTDNSKLPLYNNMLQIYKKHGGLLNQNHIEAALHALSGGTINWLLYHIESVCTRDIPEEKYRVCSEIEGVLMSIMPSPPLFSQLLKIR
jgi:hypothetical protein